MIAFFRRMPMESRFLAGLISGVCVGGSYFLIKKLQSDPSVVPVPERRHTQYSDWTKEIKTAA